MGPKKTPNYFFNRVLMSRLRNKHLSFVMVEGRTDEAFWSEFISRDNCKLERVDGKPEIMKLLTSNVLRNLPGFAAIVDADYWLITQSEELETENLLYDENYPDVEVTLVSSPALNKILGQNLKKLLMRFEIIDIHNFAEKLKNESLCLAMNFGYFRLLNYFEDYGINFNGFWEKHRRIDFIDETSLEFIREQFSINLKEYCPWLSKNDLLTEVENIKEQYPLPNIQLCQGKDVIGILGEIFPILFKSEFGEELSDSIKQAFRFMELSNNLHSSYDTQYFKGSSLYACIRKWENTNSPYMILGPEM